jgi:hypothetical protein
MGLPEGLNVTIPKDSVFSVGALLLIALVGEKWPKKGKIKMVVVSRPILEIDLIFPKFPISLTTGSKLNQRRQLWSQ